MQTNVLDYLEKTVKLVPNKIAYANEKESLTFIEVYNSAKSIGSYIASFHLCKQPIVVYMEKSPSAISAFFGVVYSGNHYVPIDEEMPQYRVKLIFDTLQPQMVICDDNTKAYLDEMNYSGKVCLFDDIKTYTIDMLQLQHIK